MLNAPDSSRAKPRGSRTRPVLSRAATGLLCAILAGCGGRAAAPSFHALPHADDVTCAQLFDGNQKLVNAWGSTIAFVIASATSKSPAFPGLDEVGSDVTADLNTFCHRSIEPDYAPAADVVDDIETVIAKAAGRLP